ncbi:NeuD/PglB/VioB family sugar acetyltransferase [Rufibacter ruber]|uniref:NeuD/PglB/VioB family sugar acetyltransferase n=1 Tax=Rufibacter ruber TaxID=1783499 RepID=UPI0008363C66|nr:NeuD/PglB/VioB family sugar acetyltransferase [Rufibacter ruber]
MIIIGANGHAKDLLQVLTANGETSGLSFFDDVTRDLPPQLYGRFPILRSIDEVGQIFRNDNRFALGVGQPKIRFTLGQKFTELGGSLVSVIDHKADIGQYGVSLGTGLNVMSKVLVSNSVQIGEGCLLNAGVQVHHDVVVGKYTELSPGTIVNGGATIGDFSFLGAASTVLPKVKIGINVVIGAGAVVTRDIPDHSVAVGVPARVIKTNTSEWLPR